MNYAQECTALDYRALPASQSLQISIKSRLCKEHCYKKKAASAGQNGRLSGSCNFLSFLLIKPLNLGPCGPTDKFS